MGSGWIKLHRKSKNHWLYQETPFDRYHAWTDLLLSVNHEQNTFLLGNTLLTVERGQVVTSLRKLGERWGWNQEKVRKFLNLLVSDAMIEIRCDTTKTVITIANWDFYQSDAENRRHDLDTTLTQTVTNKNEKNDKNDKKTKKGTTDIGADAPKRTRFVPPTLEAVAAYCHERRNGIDPQYFIDHYTTRGWIPKGSTKQMSDWKAAVRTWERRNKEFSHTGKVSDAERRKQALDAEIRKEVEARNGRQGGAVKTGKGDIGLLPEC